MDVAHIHGRLSAVIDAVVRCGGDARAEMAERALDVVLLLRHEEGA